LYVGIVVVVLKPQAATQQLGKMRLPQAAFLAARTFQALRA